MTRKLDRLNASNSSGVAFQRLWQRNCETVEQNFTDLASQVAAIAAAQATANTAITNAATAQTTANTGVANAATAQSTANTATTNAATAQTTANTVKRDDKIGSSSVIPANVLTATDAGTDATIVVAAHTRLYNDGSQLSVGGHTFTACAYGTDFGIFYDDTTCADTTPTYQKTTTLSHALNSFVAGRHFVGIVATPASGGAPTTGGSTPVGTDTSDRNQLASI